MTAGRSRPAFVLNSEHRTELEVLRGSRRKKLALRAQVVLLGAEGLSNTAIAKHVGLSNTAVGRWRQRFIERGIPGLYDRLRPGRPRTITNEALIEVAKDSWGADRQAFPTVRQLAYGTGASKSTVQRIARFVRPKPFLTSPHLMSIEAPAHMRLIDLIGLYVHPPTDFVFAFCVDKETGTESLQNASGVRSLDIDFVEGVTYDGVSPCPRTLSVATDIAIAIDLSELEPKPRRADEWFLSFLANLEASVPAEFDVYIGGSCVGCKHRRVRKWLAGQSRFHLETIDTIRLWRDQLKYWLEVANWRAAPGAPPLPIQNLLEKVDLLYERRYRHPFIWTATTNSLGAKIAHANAAAPETL